MSLLSPLRPVLANDEQLIELLGNAFTFERVLCSPTSSPKSSVGSRQQLPWRPAHRHTCDVASPTKKPNAKVAEITKEDLATEKRKYYWK